MISYTTIPNYVLAHSGLRLIFHYMEDHKPVSNLRSAILTEVFLSSFYYAIYNIYEQVRIIQCL